MLKHLLSTTTAALILSGAAAAQIHGDRSLEPGSGTEMPTAPESSLGTMITADDGIQRRADNLIGMTVLTTDGAVVGDVTDLILDQDHRLRGIIVSTGGLLGFRGGDVGVSWDQAEVRSDPETNNPVIVLDLMRADIQMAPNSGSQENIEAERAAAGVE